MTADLFSRMAHKLTTGLASGVDRPTDDASLYAWVVDQSLMIFDAALGQTMAKGGIAAQTVVSSPWQ